MIVTVLGTTCLVEEVEEAEEDLEVNGENNLNLETFAFHQMTLVSMIGHYL